MRALFEVSRELLKLDLLAMTNMRKSPKSMGCVELHGKARSPHILPITRGRKEGNGLQI
jgi:hypothetical protein